MSNLNKFIAAKREAYQEIVQKHWHRAAGEFVSANNFVQEVDLFLESSLRELLEEYRKEVEARVQTVEPTGCPDGISGCAVYHSSTVTRPPTWEEMRHRSVLFINGN